MEINNSSVYHRSCIKILFALLALWFVVSFGCGILWREWLDLHAHQIGNAPFGFWMAQQGSIIFFVLILVSYFILMNRLDKKHGYTEEENS